MASTTLKRSAATLGVLAGLLAAAAPAGAQFWEANKQSAYFLELSFDAKSAKENLYFMAPGPTDGTQVGSEGVRAPTAGTQIGIED